MTHQQHYAPAYSDPDLLTLNDVCQLPEWERQLDMDDTMRRWGEELYNHRLEQAREKGQESFTPSVRRVMMQAIEDLTGALEEYLEAAKSKPGTMHDLVRYASRLEPEAVAYLTVQSVFDRLTRKSGYSDVSRSVGQRLEDEVNSRLYREIAAPSWKKSMKMAAKQGRSTTKWRVLLNGAEHLGLDSMEEWSTTTKIRVGQMLVSMLAQCSGLIEVKVDMTSTFTRGRRQPKKVCHVVATPETMKWLETEDNALAGLLPIYLPTVVPPRPWTGPYNGGYWLRVGRQLRLLKTDRKTLDKLKTHEMPVVYQAINALQNTPWAINQNVLDTYKCVKDLPNFEVPGMVRHHDEELPVKPQFMEERRPSEEWTEQEMAQFKVWRQEARGVKERNTKRACKVKHSLRVEQIADLFRDDVIYFPHKLDWRGRAYPIPNFLQPQGGDLERALLCFAESVEVGDEQGEMWLAVHGAGMWGVDKVSFEDRLAWVRQHQEQILDCASDPLTHRFWLEAEKPWGALAFCFEWAGFYSEGYAYKSRLPVQMDGTCNGLQHFSAMLRDEVGGKATNLIPSDVPQDIYGEVCKIVQAKVVEDLDNPDTERRKFSSMWHGVVDRKVCKRPVMTLAYGARRYGFGNMLVSDTINPWHEERPGKAYPFTYVDEKTGETRDCGQKAASHLAGHLWDATSSVVKAASEAMEWLQEATKLVSAEGLATEWTTPVGLPVKQAYMKQKAKVIETTFNKVRRQSKIWEDTNELDKIRQRERISPNFVHSLDAAHLQLTAAQAEEAGIHSMAMIHDSYGTHAGNCEALASLIRETFVRLYTETDPLADFRDDILARAPGLELPPLPKPGSLDLEQVKDSKFFFA